MSTKPSSCNTQFENQFTIVPSDSVDMAIIPAVIFVGTGGDVACIAAGDTSSKIMKNLPDGYTINGRIKRVLSTGTTATDMLGQY